MKLSEFDFDLFVIGAGSGGVRASRIAAGLGAKVAVAEERYFGGTCVNVGCVPKKLFSYAAHYRHDFADSAGFGWEVAKPIFNWRTLIDNKNKEIKRLNGIYEELLSLNGVKVFQAKARLKDAHTIEVDGQQVTAKHILLAVGGWPWIPQFPGSDLAISSNEVFHLEALPEQIVIVGGGYIALEFASIFSGLGVETTLVYRGDKFLRGFDEDIRDFITAEVGRNVTIKLQDNVTKIVKNNNGLKVTLESGSELDASQVLMATGRVPLTADLGLENVGVELSKTGGIKVNAEFQTTEPSIYAVGDVIERVALTPVALAEGQLVARSLFDKTSGSLSYENIATAVFCHPNIGTVGLSEQDALANGLDIDVYTSTFRTLKHTLSGSAEKTFLKLIVDKATDLVLGLHMVGPDAGELVQGFAVAMNCGARKADFDRTIGIHPTLAEEFVTMRTPRVV
ncbi:MAG: glutathione reductase (NADPH) [Pseudohongiellaceae bacterium]|jgi:glutathione reductase (NADPH)